MRGVWSHRALVGARHPENSLAAVDHAAEQGVPGVEVDVFWHRDRFVLAHDRPTGGEPTLEAALERQPGLAFWLDLKNLRELTRPRRRRLRDLLGDHGQLGRSFVESGHWRGLKRLKASGVPIAYTLGWSSLVDRRRTAEWVRRLDPDGLCLSLRVYRAWADRLPQRRLHLFTARRWADVVELRRKDPRVGIVLTELPPPETGWPAGHHPG